MGRKTHGSHKVRRRGVVRGVKVGSLVALLALLVAVPVALAAVTSSTSYTNFADNGNPGDNHWRNTNQTVSVLVQPSAGTTATAYFSSDGGATYTSKTYGTMGTAAFDFLVIAEGSNAVRYAATDTGGSVRGHEVARLRQHRQDRAGHDGHGPRTSLDADR